MKLVLATLLGVAGLCGCSIMEHKIDMADHLKQSMKRYFSLFYMGLVIALTGLLVQSPAFASFDREDRINEVVPLSDSVQQALDSLKRRAPQAQYSQLKEAVHTRARLRALKCSQGATFSASSSPDEIRNQLSDSKCFSEADAEFTDWLQQRIVGLAISEPPVRPVTTGTARFIATDTGPVQSVHAASRAGVAIATSWSDIALVDLENGKTIQYAKLLNSGIFAGLSSNGRVYAINQNGKIQLHDAVTDAALGTMAPCWASTCGFHWLDDRSALLMPASNQKSTVFDLKTGVQASFGPGFDPIIKLSPLLEKGEFIAFSNTAVTRFKLDYDDGKPSVTSLSVKPLKLNLIGGDGGGLTPNGAYFVNTSNGDLKITQTDTLDTETVSLSPFSVYQAIPTADSDKIFITGNLPATNNGWLHYIYSIAAKTLTPVDTGKLTASRFVYIPGAQKLAAISDAGFSIIADIPTQSPTVTMHDFVADAAQQRRAAEAERMKPPVPVSLHELSPIILASRDQATSASVQPLNPPLGSLARDADIQGIGVHSAQNPTATITNTYIGDTKIENAPEGTAPIHMYKRHHGATPPATNVITVHVKATSKPLVLVLSSYESVHWSVKLDSGARLKAILLSGFHGSDVVGAEGARVAAIGQEFSDALGTPQYDRLQKEVLLWTGKPMGFFQCGHEATEFTVEGTRPLADSDFQGASSVDHAISSVQTGTPLLKSKPSGAAESTTVVLGADGKPAIRFGLWEINQSSKGIKNTICMNADAAQAEKDLANQFKKSLACSKDEYRLVGNVETMDIACSGGSQLSMHSVTTHFGDTAYHVETTTHTSAGDSSAIADAKWLGACPQGMQPGDVSADNGTKVNALALVKSLSRDSSTAEPTALSPIGCISVDQVSNLRTPEDILPGVRACINSGDYDKAVQLFDLSAVFGIYDTLRVPDNTAHQALQVLNLVNFDSLTPEQKDTFKKAGLSLRPGSRGFNALCSKIQSVGPPTYIPTYMINHGLNAFMGGRSGNGLQPDFDAKKGWKDALTGFMKCPEL